MEKSRRSPIKIIAYTIILLIILIFGFLAAFPTLLSISGFREAAVRLINERTQNNVSISNLNLSWFGNQTIDGLTLKDEKGITVANIDKFFTDIPLWKWLCLAWSNNGFQAVPFSGNILLSKGDFSFYNNDRQIGKLSNVEVKIATNKVEDTLIVHVNGYAEQKNQSGQFSIDGLVANQDLQNISIKIQDLPTEIIDQLIAKKQPQLKGLVQKIGEKVTIHVDRPSPKDQINFQLTSSAKDLQTKIQGNIQAANFFESWLVKINGQFTTPQAAYPITLTANIDNPLGKLSTPLHMVLNIDQLPIPLLDQLLDTNGILYKTLGTKAEISIEGSQNGSSITLDLNFKSDKLSIPSAKLSLGDKISLIEPAKIAFILQSNTSKGMISEKPMAITIQPFTLDPREITKGHFHISSELDTDELIGSHVMVNLDLHLTPKNATKANLDVNIVGERIRGDISLIADENFSLSTNSEKTSRIEWELTNERLSTLRSIFKTLWKVESNEEQKLVLQQPVNIILDINHLFIPSETRSDGNFQLAFLRSAIHIDLKADKKISMFDSGKRQQVNFDGASASFETKDLSQTNFVKLECKEITSTQTDKKGSFALSGSSSNLVTKNEIHFGESSLDVNVNAKYFPIILVCRMAHISSTVQAQIEALIGPEISTNLHIVHEKMLDSLVAKFIGSQGRVAIDGQVSQSGILTLNKPFEAELTVTPLFSKTFLKEIMPLLSSAVSAERPVRITIDSNGFSLPIKEQNFYKTEIRKCTIDLGKVEFKNEGQLTQVLSLLNADNSRDQHNKVWFTPLYLSMHNGEVGCERMDMLINNRYPIAIWGIINFPQDKVRLRIGLSADALQQSIGIKGLDKNYMLIVPFRGTLQDASIDKTKTMVRISSLLAKKGGGPQGAILGGVIDLVTGGLKEEKAPAPTTTPLPWSK